MIATKADLQALFESDLSVPVNRLILADALEDAGKPYDARMARDLTRHVAAYPSRALDGHFLVDIIGCQRRYFLTYPGIDEPKWTSAIVPYFMAKRFAKAFPGYTKTSRESVVYRIRNTECTTLAGAEFHVRRMLLASVQMLYKAEKRT